MINAAVSWMNESKVPLIMSAVNAKDRVDYPTVLRIEEIKQLMEDVNKGIYPLPITFLTLNEYYNQIDHEWYNDYEKRVRLEVMNGEGSVDANDTDGDFLSNDYEITISGTDPHNPDSDRDNISDFAESLLDELNPNDPSDGNPPGDLSINGDYDGDGISNVIELSYALFDGEKATITQTLDITDPNDSETSEFDNDATPNVWEAIMGFNLDHHTTYYLRETTHDSNADHDGDGVLTVDEINNNTWPIVNYDDYGDRDDDYELAGDDDKMPYVHDAGHAVAFDFASLQHGDIDNFASQRIFDTGHLIGEGSNPNGVLVLTGTGYISIPAAGHHSMPDRSVHFHFQAGETTDDQILYAEGDETNGLSIGISDNHLVASIWSDANGTVVHEHLNHAIDFDTWYAITVLFDSQNQQLKFMLYEANRPVSRIKADLPFTQLSLNNAGDPELGGNTVAVKLYVPATQDYLTVEESYYYGFIDDFHLYDRLLSETEVSLLSRNDLFPAKDLPMNALPPKGSGTDNGYNFIKNPGFEEGEVGWSNNKAQLRQLIQPGQNESNNAYQVSGDLNSGVDYIQSIQIDNQEEYFMAFWAKGKAGEQCKMRVHFDEGSSVVFTATFSSTDTWEYFADTIQTPASVQSIEKIQILCGTDLSPQYQSISIDNIHLGPIIYVDIEDVSATDLKIYPNPVKHTISFLTNGHVENVKIYNLNGVKVLDGTNVSHLSKGLYILTATVDKQPVRKKFNKD
ncbi:T9SS type A sorting domain-containing protein [Carboxylicivirga marina]|uniref:T9SS type A sorting domain-containing protein n=1 Tax=Carboxylicivirga marina TaxID=2800988 RepID=UPI00259A4F6E|nr:T9SS type A sorting domain-containing protein [uncultured Carboxylicivirga sp.]